MTIVIDKESHSWEVGYDKGYEIGEEDTLDKLKRYFSFHCNDIQWHGFRGEEAFERIWEQIQNNLEEEKQ